jgi:hypothetical protein
MNLLSSNQALLQDLRHKAKKRSEIFSWNEAGKKVLELYKIAIATPAWMKK